MPLDPGYTVADVAARFRVGADKVRTWINRGELVAINTATVTCAKPRYVITPDALVAFEKRRKTGPAPKQAKRRVTKAEVDFYPD